MRKITLLLIGLFILMSNSFAQITWMGDEVTNPSFSGTLYLGDPVNVEIQSYPKAPNQGAQIYIDWQNDGYGSVKDIDWFALVWSQEVGNNNLWKGTIKMREIGTHNRKYLGWESGKTDYITDNLGTFTVSALGTPTSFTGSAISNTQINLSWEKWVGLDNKERDVIIVRTEEGLIPTLVQGTTYNAGDNLPDGGTVLYRGNGTSYNNSGLTPGTEYTYTIFSENWSYYSDGVSITVTAPVSSATDYFRSMVTGDWNSTTTWESSPDNVNWFSASITPGNQSQVVTIRANHLVTVTENATASKVIIEQSGQLTVNNGITLTTTEVILNSDANGTATVVGNVTGNAKVYQWLTSKRNWYMSSPIDGGVIPAYTRPGIIEYYDEKETNADLAARWKVAEGNTYQAGQGLVVYPTWEDPYAYEFAGGSLNNGNKAIALTRTESKTSEVGFNLVGNPYPSYYNANILLMSNSDVLPTIWYRTKEGANYVFQQYNAEGGIEAPANSNLRYIPPMQAFWVRVKAGQTTGTLAFNNANSFHKFQIENPGVFRAPQAPVNQILRLQLSNGTATDEAVIYFNENAQNAFDNYDSPKMMNNGTTVPNIYTKVDNEDLVINGMNAIPYGDAIPLFVDAKVGSYTLSASEFSNFASNDKVMLLDSKTASEVNLNLGDYSFTIAEGENANNRFTLVFPKANAPTGLDQVSKEVSVRVVGNKLLVVADEADMGSDIVIFNSIGQRIQSQKVNGIQNEINGELQSGVYIVKLNNRTAKVLVK